MRTITMLILVVSLAFGLQAMDVAPPTDKDSQCEAASAAVRRRDYPRAADLAGQCLAYTAAGVNRANALTVLGIALHRMDRNPEARHALDQALAEIGTAAWSTRAVALGALSGVYRALGDYSGAERALRQGAEDVSASVDDRALALISLSDLLREEGHAEDAKVLLQRAASLPALSWQRHVDLLVESAEWNRDASLWDDSIALWNEADKEVRSRHETHWDGVIAGGLGETWFTAGNPARAEPLLRRSVALLRNDPSTSSPQVATALATLAALYIAEGKLALADEAVCEAIARDEDTLGLQHPQVAAMLELQAAILVRRGETQEALDRLESARRIMTAHFGEESAALAGVFAAFGDVEEHANRPDAAAEQYSHALDLIRQAGSGAGLYANTLATRYAAVLKAAHRGAEAKAVLRSFQASTARTQSFREK